MADEVARPEVAVTSPLVGDALAMLGDIASTRVHEGPQIVEPKALARFIDGADAVVTLLANPVTHAVLTECPRLKIVANCAVGYDNIDLAAAERRRVWVTNTPDVLTQATADLAWGLILSVTRRMGEAEAFLRAGRYSGWALDLLLGCGLQGRTLGIVGMGRIGLAVAQRARAFGMHVIYADPRESAPDLERLPLDTLVRRAHIITLHCPSSHATRGLFDAKRLRSMRPGSFLVNTARGDLIDEAALVEVLREGHLGGAGLDVYECEPAVHPGLLELDNVVLLPHIGSATRETRAAMAELAAKNAIEVLKGNEPPTPVVRGAL